MRVLADAGLFTRPVPGAGAHWTEHLRTADLSAGTYCVPAGGVDDQSPHTEDEIYVVISGRATLVAGGESAPAVPGAVLFVPAGEPHSFTDITEDLTVLVVFGPAEYTRA